MLFRSFETADEMLLALERGAARPLPAPRPMPLGERNPIAFWRGVAIASVVVNVVLLFLYIFK